MGRSSGSVVLMGRLSGEALASWVSASCAAQGLAVKVTDAQVIARVHALLGGGDPGPGRGGRTAGTGGRRLQAPHGGDSARVKGPRPRRAGSNDRMVEDRPDDSGLAVEGEVRPLTA